MNSNILNIINQAKMIPSTAVAQQHQLVTHWQTQQSVQTTSKKRRRESDNGRSLRTRRLSPLQSNTTATGKHETQ